MIGTLTLPTKASKAPAWSARRTSAIFAEGAIGLLRRALADGLCLDITVNAAEARAVLAKAQKAKDQRIKEIDERQRPDSHE